MSLSSDIIMQEMQGMFETIGNHTLNHWGVSHGDRFCSHRCLKCSKVMCDLTEFIELGPEGGKNAWFCREHTDEYFQKMIQLEKASVKESVSIDVLFQRATEPIQQREESLKGEYVREMEESIGKSWVYLG